jgi:hypothetical protein
LDTNFRSVPNLSAQKKKEKGGALLLQT